MPGPRMKVVKRARAMRRLLRELGTAKKPLTLRKEAQRESRRVPRWLRKHAKTMPELRRLSRQINACTSAALCGSGACPRCVGTAQEWLARAGARFLRQNDDLGDWKLLSWVPPGQDGSLDVPAKKRWFERELRSAGVTTAIGGIDVSWNVDKRGVLFPHRSGWTLQLWAVVRETECNRAELQLKKRRPADDEVPRPVHATIFDGKARGLAYTLKPNFVVRETILASRAGSEDPCRNTRHDDLTVDMKRELYPALHLAGIQSRLVLLGCQLRWTRKGPRIQLRRRLKDPESVFSERPPGTSEKRLLSRIVGTR